VRGRNKIQSKRQSSHWLRRAAAAVEMAIVSPILLAIMFGIAEYGWVFMLQSNVTSATREACRVGILPYSSTADADAAIKARLANVINSTGLRDGNGYSVAITRATDTTNNITTVTVTTRVPWAKASLVGGGILPNPRKLLAIFTGGGGADRTSDLVISCSMMKELGS